MLNIYDFNVQFNAYFITMSFTNYQSNLSQFSLRKEESIEKKEVQIKQQKKAVKLLQSQRQVLKECIKNIQCLQPILNPQQEQRRIIRDCLKYIELAQYKRSDILYQLQEQIHSVFMIMEGKINLSNQKNSLYINQGNILGYKQCRQNSQSEFSAIVSSQTCLVGRLSNESLKEIVELFHQREMGKKVQMLRNCPLLVNLRKNSIDTIAENSTPHKFKLSQLLFLQGQKLEFAYLIINGQIQLHKNIQVKNKNLNTIFSLPKIKINTNSQKKSLKTLQTVISTGQFIGDYQIWSRSSVKYRAICITEQALVLTFNVSLIAGLLSEDDYLQSSPFYQLKDSYLFKRMQSFVQFKNRQTKKVRSTRFVQLSPQQKQIKSKIMARYVQKVPTMIDKLSPIQIQKIIKKRTKKIKTLPIEDQFSMMQSLISSSLKKRKLAGSSSSIKLLNSVRPLEFSQKKSLRSQHYGKSDLNQSKSLIIGIKAIYNQKQQFQPKQQTSLRTRQMKQIMGGVQNYEVRQISRRMQINRRNSNF